MTADDGYVPSRWHLEDYDPDVDEAPPGDPEHDCTGEPDDGA